MGRLLAVVTVATALLLVGGCSSGRDGAVAVPSSPVGSPSGAQPFVPTPTGSAPDAGATAGGNAREVCVAVGRAGSAGAETYLAELGKMLAAGDAGAAERARRAAEAALTDWVAALREQADRATDPQLKGALADVGAEVGKLRADLGSIEETRLEQLQRRVDQLCAG
jgi:hypothetical protein